MTDKLPPIYFYIPQKHFLRGLGDLKREEIECLSVIVETYEQSERAFTCYVYKC
ncbi:hypothetical protein SAMD00079811_29750 [Scytonema sp. HK-05]|nr:hypothetical protein SAMD00079811_29750 [Scytonema sp. HK-05]